MHFELVDENTVRIRFRRPAALDRPARQAWVVRDLVVETNWGEMVKVVGDPGDPYFGHVSMEFNVQGDPGFHVVEVEGPSAWRLAGARLNTILAQSYRGYATDPGTDPWAGAPAPALLRLPTI